MAGTYIMNSLKSYYAKVLENWQKLLKIYSINAQIGFKENRKNAENWSKSPKMVFITFIPDQVKKQLIIFRRQKQIY
jgi:hypothetical protein